MARGNDSSAALVDLRGEYGATSGNAEDLIASARHAYGPELRTANLLPRDQTATESLLEDEGLETVNDKVSSGTVIDAAVHGDWVVVVVESDESGRTFKEAYPRSEFGGPKSSARVAAQVEESDDEKGVREAYTERMELAAEAAEASRKADEAAEAARAKAAASRKKKPADDSE